MKGMSVLKSVNSLNFDLKFIGHGKTSKCCWVWNTAELNILKCWKMVFFLFPTLYWFKLSFMLHENCWCWIFPEHAVKVKELQGLPWQSVWCLTINSIRNPPPPHTHTHTQSTVSFTQKSYLHTLIRVKLRNRRAFCLITMISFKWRHIYVACMNSFHWSLFIFSCSSCRRCSQNQITENTATH